ncbi:response regulator transcription factor [Streptomyces zhihengii]|uniref:Response regulator transcription factor n=1 Tax=Streptomyces zhihengii TaxID=1818004 RepID=A0ABS2V4H8_9ACTN|nr:LuxR C-terminal-related transcriptional regulator [Streptomyces zhihengii]MBM9624523.1 response regulator transcription factor [Streptomyces zhihengii]
MKSSMQSAEDADSKDVIASEESATRRRWSAGLPRVATVHVRGEDALTRAGLSRHLVLLPWLMEIEADVTQAADVCVFGVRGTGESLPTSLKRISCGPKCRFVLLVDDAWETDISSVVHLGVRAVLWRSKFSPRGFESAIRSAVEMSDLTDSSRDALVRKISQTRRQMLSPGDGVTGFTAREIDVLRFLAAGMDLEKISAAMSYSERTIKNILYGAMKRHKLQNRTHLVSYAIRAGLI